MESSTRSQRSESTLLRRALRADGAFEAVTGLVLILGATRLATLFGVPRPSIVIGVGIMLLLLAAWLFRIAAREPLKRSRAMLVATLNYVWVIASVTALLTGVLPLTTGARWAIVIVAVLVAIFGDLQFVGLWQTRGIRAAETARR